MAEQDHTVTKDLLHRIFDYKDGNLYWKDDRGANKVAGSIAGYKDPKGYVIIVLNKIHYRAHRLIYIMFNGYTNQLIDHIMDKLYPSLGVNKVGYILGNKSYIFDTLKGIVS